MKKYLCSCLVLLCILLQTHAQEKPEFRDFNVGISSGIGGVHYLLIPSIDLSFGPHTLRVVPYPASMSIGVELSMYQLRVRQDMLNLVADFGYNYTTDKFDTPNNFTRSPFKSHNVSLLVGGKFTFAQRMCIRIKSGLQVINVVESENLAYHMLLPIEKNQASLYSEFSIGIQLFKNFK